MSLNCIASSSEFVLSRMIAEDLIVNYGKKQKEER